jgi:hypothetical protein
MSGGSKIEACDLDRLDFELLRRRWRSVIGRHPPKTVPRALMARILNWREQIADVGDVDPRTRAILAAALRGGDDDESASGGRAGKSGTARSSALATVRLGTVFVREHRGILHRVTAVPQGYEWNGQAFRSLSAVARAITGVSWNGRRFFGVDRGAVSGGEPCLRDGPESPRSPVGYPPTRSRRKLGSSSREGSLA